MNRTGYYSVSYFTHFLSTRKNLCTKKHFLYKRTCAKKEDTLSFYEKDKPLLSLSGSRERGQSPQLRGRGGGALHCAKKDLFRFVLVSRYRFWAHLFEDALNLLAVPPIR